MAAPTPSRPIPGRAVRRRWRQAHLGQRPNSAGAQRRPHRQRRRRGSHGASTSRASERSSALTSSPPRTGPAQRRSCDLMARGLSDDHEGLKTAIEAVLSDSSPESAERVSWAERKSISIQSLVNRISSGGTNRRRNSSMAFTTRKLRLRSRSSAASFNRRCRSGGRRTAVTERARSRVTVAITTS